MKKIIINTVTNADIKKMKLIKATIAKISQNVNMIGTEKISDAEIVSRINEANKDLWNLFVEFDRFINP